MKRVDALIFLARSAQASAVGADAVRGTCEAVAAALEGEADVRCVAIQAAAVAAVEAMHVAERAQMQFSALLNGGSRA